MSKTVSLISCQIGKIATVKKINAGYKAHQFLADLGVHEGEKVRIVKNDFGPIIVEIKDTRVAIGRGLAEKITVDCE